MSLAVFVFFLFLVFYSCSDTPTIVAQPGAKLLYFDLKGYFDQEVKRLADFTRVKKIATVDGQREEQTLEAHDFALDLKIFTDADINRASWSDKYVVDSVFNNQRQLVRLDYTANDMDLRTQKISIEFEEGNVSKIFIENSSSSAVADTKQLLTYRPSSGYAIESRQKVALSGDHVFLVEVQFLSH